MIGKSDPRGRAEGQGECFPLLVQKNNTRNILTHVDSQSGEWKGCQDMRVILHIIYNCLNMHEHAYTHTGACPLLHQGITES